MRRAATLEFTRRYATEFLFHLDPGLEKPGKIHQADARPCFRYSPNVSHEWTHEKIVLKNTKLQVRNTDSLMAAQLDPAE